MPPFFVLGRADASSAWTRLGGPYDTAQECAPTVQQTLKASPTGVAIVVDVVRSYRAAVTVSQDPTPTIAP